MASTADTVANAKCFVCLTHRQHLSIQTYLLAILAGTTTSPATLLRLAGCVSCIPHSKLLSLQAYLLAVAQGQSTDPRTLMLAANCNCVPPGIENAVRTYGLAALAGGSQDPETLAPLARCFMCLSSDQTDYIQTYLMGVWAGIDVSTISGINSALDASSAFSGLSNAQLKILKSYLEGNTFVVIPCIAPVLIGCGVALSPTYIQFNWNITSGPPDLDYVFFWGKISGGPYTNSGTGSRLADGAVGLQFAGVFEYYDTWYGIVSGRDTATCVGYSPEDSYTMLPPIGGDTVIIDDGTGNFWKIVVATDGMVGAESDAGPATSDVILNDGTGALWKLIVATDGMRGTESSAGPQVIAPVIDDGTGQLWRLIVDTGGNLGAMTVP